MGLKPWEFERMTPREFERYVAGYRKRQEQEWYRVAWLACYILAPYSKRKVTPEKLLGLKRPDKERRVTLRLGHPGELPSES